ncbi:alkaline phosphatase family protein [Planctomycetota bacterium]
MKAAALAAVTVLVLLGFTREAYGYVGPGAGFAFLSSFLIFFAAFALAGLIFLTTPIRLLVRIVRRRRRLRGRFSRVVVVGLDGMSPVVARRMIDAGQLPNFTELERSGSFHALESTLPAVSPVAWSTFQTGTNPDRHNIFDFLARDKATYLPVLSSSRVEPPRRTLKLGKRRIPIGKPRLALLRKSKPFWKVLGEHGVFSIVLRVPITFPPEKFHGLLLAGMCVPDLRGTQGSFTYLTTETVPDGEHTGGTRIRLQPGGHRINGAIPGPVNPLLEDDKPLEVAVSVVPDKDGKAATLLVSGEKVRLEVGKYSPWIRLRFRAGPGWKMSGICRFLLQEAMPEVKLYVTPLNIDPEKPLLPISSPFTYAPYLAKVFGPYATLGLAEDTWALNEKILGEGEFLDQTYEIHRERETMFFDALSKVDHGMVACVFDVTDRIQHMFWKYTPEARAAGCRPDSSDHEEAVEECYRRMDEMLGRVRRKLRPEDLLIVMSDHGFAAFHTCVNLNAWLYQHGLLVLKDNAQACAGCFENVDWSRSKAYALGLGGIYVNLAGREKHGIVRAGEERQAVIREIVDGLLAIEDPQRRCKAVNRVFDVREHYTGPYVDNAPDLFVGFADGYRVSWDCVTGEFGTEIVQRNERSWSGDHCIDPGVVPGVIFSNRPLRAKSPGIVDVAPTVMDAFGVPIPGYVQGKSLLNQSHHESP